MAANYWAKMWIEMLDDRKTATLPDSSWRRFVECILLAKELDADGYLPALPDMAFRLRVDATALDDDMTRLALAGLVERRENDRWYVTNFSKRQAKVSGAERVARHREAKRKANPTEAENVTEVKRDSNVAVTNRYTEKRREEKETEKEGETERASAASPPSSSPDIQAIGSISNALTDVTGVSSKLNRQAMYEFSADLHAAGYTAAQVHRHYGREPTPGAWHWYTDDWRGSKGDKPSLRNIRETIAGAIVDPPKVRQNGSKQQSPKSVSNPAPGSQPVTW